MSKKRHVAGTEGTLRDSASCACESFLRRPPLVLDRATVAASLGGKRILVTGAGGWIGSALTKAIAGFAPEHLVLLEAAERNLYEIDAAVQRLPVSIRPTSVLGSVADPVVVGDIFRRFRPQTIYHAAAFKHVPLMEQNPFAAIENNTIGTSLLAQAAVEHQAEQLILVSTDKAVDPSSAMGASKRIAELILLAERESSTRMKAVRLGNVFGSEGSIVPLFLQQILSGGPVTVTHPDARRYFLTTEDAVTLLLLASSAETAQGILVPELGEPVRVASGRKASHCECAGFRPTSHCVYPVATRRQTMRGAAIRPRIVSLPVVAPHCTPLPAPLYLPRFSMTFWRSWSRHARAVRLRGCCRP